MCYVVGLFVSTLMLNVPATTDMTAWYFGSTVMLMGVIVVLAALGLYTAVGGRLWKGDARA